MTKAQKMFEAIMRVKGHTDFTMTNGRYNHAGLALRGGYVQRGGEVGEVSG